MNTIITRHYPASKLPEDLREGISPSSLVTVTITQRRASPLAAGADTGLGDRATARKEVDIELRGGLDEQDE
jgi:hypothetical protein